MRGSGGEGYEPEIDFEGDPGAVLANTWGDIILHFVGISQSFNLAHSCNIQ